MTEKKKTQKQPIDPEKYEYITEAPDGGYGWVIVIAAMLCNLVCDGALFAFGTMKIYLQEHFKCSDMLIMMVGSVPCGVYLLVGPLVSGLTNMYGSRIMIIIGSIGSAVTMVLSTFSPNVWVMMVVYGIFGGIFFGMVYLPSVVMVSFYFEKKRALANGMVTAGTGIGVLSFGPLANVIMKNFGWEIGMYVFAGLMLLCILFGAVMSPLEPKQILKKHNDEPGVENQPNAPISPDPTSPLIGNKETTTDPKQVNRNRRVSEVSHRSATSFEGHRIGVVNPDDATRVFNKKDALLMGSNQQLNRASRLSLHSQPYVAAATNTKSGRTQKDAFMDILKAMTEFSILKNKQILLICIGNIFSMLGYYLPIMCLVSFAIENMEVGTSVAPFLMTLFGLCNTIGRFVSGPISMLPYCTALRVHNAFLFLSGVSTVLAVYAFNFTTAALYASVCGFCIASHMSLMPSIIVDCIGLDRFTNAFGILFLFRGAASMVGPPAAGFLKDYTKNYEVAFAVGGAMIIIASFFHISVAFFKSDIEKEGKEVQA